ncbi:SDR family oxidoreductase [Nitrosophilus alvini]|uniref:SDR family oxidoreductase n=1 Tax=Nitrosophilus alvini TaxID=2714855 RepID=UPI00190B514C|nr:SDR family NAD(P)-dependent oxidoreductase [Nitrosophilus alvini]
MKTALVTGATSGIGEAIALKLLDMNYKVYGVARDFEKLTIEDENFIKVELDLSCTKTVNSVISDLNKHTLFDVLVNSAGFGLFGPYEDISVESLEQLIDTNLKAPLIITKLLLKNLKKTKGFIINISSIEAIKNSRFSAAYSATKAGLRHFSLSLFEEVRKSGVKVVSINPDMTKTPFYDELRFSTSKDPLSYITPKCISDTVEYILTAREGTVITDITLRPQIVKIEKKSSKENFC